MQIFTIDKSFRCGESKFVLQSLLYNSNNNRFQSTQILFVFLLAFAFKLMACAITVYSVTISSTATEIAPAAAILTSAFGIIPACIIVNLVWFIVTVLSFYLMMRWIPEGRVRHITLELSSIFVVLIAAVDGTWDLVVLLNSVYSITFIAEFIVIIAVIVVAALLLSTTTAFAYLKMRFWKV